MRFIFVIFFGFLFNTLWSQQKQTFYVPPFVHVNADTSFWEIPYQTPCYLYANSPFEFKSNYGLNSRDGRFRLKIFCHYDSSRIEQMPRTMQEVYGFVPEDSLSFSNWSVFSDEKSGELTMVDVSEHYAYIIIQTNIKRDQAAATEWLFGWLNNVGRMEPMEMDRLVGYPFQMQQNLSEIREQRVRDLRKWLKKGTFSQMNKLYQDPIDTSFFDFFFMRDRQMEYSFQKYHNAQIRDKSKSFSRDEYLSFLLHPSGDADLTFLKEFAGESNVMRSSYAAIELTKLLSPEIAKAKLDFLQSPLVGANPYLLVFNEKKWQVHRVSFGAGGWESQLFGGEFVQSNSAQRRSLLGGQQNTSFETAWLDELGNVLSMKERLAAGTSLSEKDILRSRLAIANDSFSRDPLYFELTIPKKAEYIFESRNNGSLSTNAAMGAMAFREYATSADGYVYFNFYERIENQQWKLANWAGADFDWKEVVFIYPIFFSDINSDGQKEIWSATVMNNKVLDCVIYEYRNGRYERSESKLWHRFIPLLGIELERELERERELEQERELEREGVSTLPYYNQGMDALVNQIKRNLNSKNRFIYGKVFLSLHIDAFGRVLKVDVDENQTGEKVYSEDIKRAAEVIEGFVPATLDGRNVEAVLKVVVPFY